VFQHRIESNEIEDWDLRLTSDSWVIEPPNGTSEISVKVARIIEEFPGTNRFVLNPTGSEPLPTFAAGAHIAIQLPTGLLRTYSLCAPADNGGSYQIAVALAPDSRGGSKYLHESVKEGDVLTISPPANLFEMSRGRHQVFIAAGIGITPFFSMIAEAEANGESFELHYCVDDTADYPFKSELSAQGERVRVYSLDESLDVGALLDEVRAEQTHVYACGSPGFVDLIRDEARHWDDENVHYENFSVDQSNAKPFVVTIRETGQEIKVDADTSLLDALRDSHLHVESDCEVGICGTCRVRYTGAVDHKDTYLTKSEKREWMTSCVSRAKGAELQISLR
jgi:ferredoxin-NADP reductase